jgi:hypothetical protein
MISEKHVDSGSDTRHDAPRARALGVATGILLGLVAALLCLSLIRSAGARGYDAVGPAILQMVLAFALGLPLLAANLAITVHLQRRHAARGILRWQWLPVGGVAALALCYQALTGFSDDKYKREHPAVSELHVNLSGRRLWRDPSVSALALEAEPAGVTPQFRQMTRERHDDPMAEYAGPHLAPGLTHLRVYFTDPSQQRGGAPALMPLVVARAPDLARIAPALTAFEPALDFMYYHYPDRVEVAPTLRIPDTAAGLGPTAQVPLVFVIPHNLTDRPIIRLEVDGLTLRLDAAIQPDTRDNGCAFVRLPAITALDAPVTVRWQAAQNAPAWQKAMVAAPGFEPLQPAEGSVRENAWHLYFLPDGSVSARRAQLLALGDKELGVRQSDVVPPLPLAPACGYPARWR